MNRGSALAAATFVLLSVPMCAIWPRVATAISGLLDEPAARVLLRTSPDVVWSDHTLSNERVIVLGNNNRRRLAPILAKTKSFSVPIFLSLAAASLVFPATRRRLLQKRGVVALGLATLAVVVVEVLVAWLAVSYALAVDNGRAPGSGMRLATVTANAVRGFIPFAAALLATLAAGRPEADT